MTKVEFRVWTENASGFEGEVLALFPDDLHVYDGQYLCSAFDVISGHGDADYNSCIARTRMATPAEYERTYYVLTFNYEYDLKISRIKHAIAERYPRIILAMTARGYSRSHAISAIEQHLETRAAIWRAPSIATITIQQSIKERHAR